MPTDFQLSPIPSVRYHTFAEEGLSVKHQRWWFSGHHPANDDARHVMYVVEGVWQAWVSVQTDGPGAPQLAVALAGLLRSNAPTRYRDPNRLRIGTENRLRSCVAAAYDGTHALAHLLIWIHIPLPDFTSVTGGILVGAGDLYGLNSNDQHSRITCSQMPTSSRMNIFHNRVPVPAFVYTDDPNPNTLLPRALHNDCMGWPHAADIGHIVRAHAPTQMTLVLVNRP